MGDFDTVWEDLPSTDTPITSAWLTAQDKAARSNRPSFRVDVVEDYGAVVNGSTDDTTAWQNAINACASAGGGVIYSSKRGVSVIAGALTDTGAANCQIKLPSVDYVDSENITILIEGPVPPPNVFSVIGTTPLPDGHLVLKSTLTSGSGGSMIGARGPVGTFGNFTNVTLRIENVGFRMPANPTHTALDLRYVASVDLDNVTVDAGNYYVEGISEPTTSGSYAIRCPGNDNGAHVRLGQVDVIGFYNGFEFSEHTVGESVSAWGCRRGFTFLASNHASKFQRLMAVHCQRGIVGSGTHYVDIDQYNIEHGPSGTWVTTYDVDDASNYLHGTLWWHVVLGGTGIDATFTVNGASNLNRYRVGTASGGGGGSTIYVARDRLVASAGNNTLTLGATPVANSPIVWVNNTIKWPTTNYTIASNVITFLTDLSASDVVMVYYDTTNSSPSASVLSTASTGVSFAGPSDVALATDASNTSAVSLASRMTFATSGTVTKLRLYARVAGTYKMRLQDAGGTVLATPSNVVVSSAGWVDFPISQAVSSGTPYVVVGFFPNGQWKNYDYGVDTTHNGITFSLSAYTFAGDITNPGTLSGHVFYFVDVVFL